MSSDPAGLEFSKSQEAVYRNHVEKIVASATFKRAGHLCQFLRFVVDKQISGELGDLQETIIGTQVYGRAFGYDPKEDPIVRTEARRLRRKLEEYYQLYGPEDGLVLRLPRGGYTPVFEDISGLPQPPQAGFEEIVENLPSASPPPIEIRRPIAVRSVSATARKHRLLPWFALAALLSSAVGVFLWWWSSSTPALQSGKGVVTPLTSYPGVEFSPSFAPDGQSIAFVWNGSGGNFDIYVKKLGEETPRRLTSNSAHDIQPAWSPDGKEIAFLRCWPGDRVELIVIPASGGAEHLVAALHPAQGSWEPDASVMRRHPGVTWLSGGKYLVSSDRCSPQPGSPDCLYQMSKASTGRDSAPPDKRGIAADLGAGRESVVLRSSKEGLERQRLTTPAESSAGDSLPAYSPDGSALCFIRTSSERQISELFVRQTSDGSIRQITFDGKTVSALAWLSNNQIAFTSNRAGGNRLWTTNVSGRVPEPVTEAGRAVGTLAASPDGGRIVYSEAFRNSNIWRRDISNPAHLSEPIKLISSSGGNDSARYSPDGTKIVFMSDRSGTAEIWIANANGSDPAMLTAFPKATPVGSPSWSPDGNELVFDSARDGHSIIMMIAARTGSVAQTVADEPGDNMMPTWSHDGKFIYYLRRQSGTPQVWKKALAGGTPALIALDASSEAYESPDGKNLFYISGNDILQAPSSGVGSSQQLVRDVTPSRHFALGLRGIFFVPSARDQTPRVDYYDFSTRKRHTVVKMSHPMLYKTPSLAVSPDEKMLLYSQLDDSGSDLMLLQLH